MRYTYKSSGLVKRDSNNWMITLTVIALSGTYRILKRILISSRFELEDLLRLHLLQIIILQILLAVQDVFFHKK